MDNTNKGAGVLQKSSRSLIFFSSLSLILPLVLAPFLSVSAETPNSVLVKNQLLTTYGRLPLSFEANQGQTDEQVKFLSRGRGYSVFLTPSDAVLVLRKADGKGQQAVEKSDSTLNPQHSELLSVVRMKLTGANPRPQVTGLSELPGKVNYFIGNDPATWRTNVPTYAKVKYEGVYPGVDAVYYGNQGQLEYDFIVAPGADPKTIALIFEGAENLKLDEQGDIVLQIAGGELKLRKPLVYQEIGGVRKEISAAYVLNANPKSANLKSQVGVQVASYDVSKPLIIDPVLVYSTYLGGTGADQAFGIAVNSSGNAYVVGSSASATFQSVTPVDLGPGGGTDVFVAKLNATGSALDYLTFIGGSTEDQGLGIAVDASGSAYITGRTNSSNFPTTTANAVQTSKSGSGATFDAFVTKLNAAGSALLYSSYLGGSQDESGNGITVDSTGKAYVVGQTKSTNFPIKNALRGKNGGVTDVFMAKFDPSQAGAASLIYATYLGGSGDDTGNGVAVDNSGNAYVVGTTVSTNFPTTAGVLDRNCGTDPKGSCNGGLSDAFVAKLNDNGSALIYSTYLGGNGNDIGNGVALDASGNAYVTGSTTSTNFPTTAGVFDASNNGLSDAFVAKLSAAGSSVLYSTYLGGNGNDIGNGIVVDASGNAYVTGATSSSNFPVANAFQSALAPGDSGGDAFVAKLNPAAAGPSDLVYSTYLGGSGADQGFGIALDTSRNVYVTGSTSSSTGFPIASFQPAFGGGTSDGFVTKLHEQPVTNNDSYTIPEDSLGLVVSAPGVLGNDSGSPLTAILVSGPTNGKLTLNSNGSFTYIPAANFSGIDGFTYKANDGITDSNVATVTITVTGVNDAPVASVQSVTTNEDNAKTITLGGSDVDSVSLTFSIVTGPSNGSVGSISGTSCTAAGSGSSCTASVTYTPAANYNGADSFTFKVNDGSVDSVAATVTITVTGVNDAPVASVQSVTTNEDNAKTITLGGSDVDSVSLTFSIVTGPSNGSVGSISGTSCTAAGSGSSCTASVTYTPAANYNGADSFTFKVNDGSVDSVAATVSITVNTVNDAPVANAQSVTTNEDNAKTITLGGSDVDSVSLTFSIVTGPSNGSVGSISGTSCTAAGSGSSCTASVTYTPGSNFDGTDSFTFKVNDGAADSNVATVSITINAVNDPPFFDLIADQYPNTDPFVAQTINVGITGVSPGPPNEVGAGQPVTLTAAVTASNPAGLVTIVNNPLLGSDSTRTLSYQIPSDTTGTATIRVTANDGQSENNTFFRDIAVTVQPPGTPPPALATLTGLTLGSAFVKYKVTFNPVDINGDGTTNSLDCYSVFPPQPQDNPFNLFPSNALVTPEAPPAVVAETYDTTGFGTTQVCTTPKIFEGVIDLSVWGISDLGGLTVDFTYVNFVSDPELIEQLTGPKACADGATCQNILIGSFPAGSISFTLGGTVAEKNTVLLHSVELQAGFSTKSPLAHVDVRIFDRDNPAFRNQRFNGTRVGQNPSGSLYGAIFEAADPAKGLIANCETDHSGICLTTETQTGNYLVVIKFEDFANGKIVYEGETMGPTSFVDTSVPPDGTGDFAEATFEIIRKNRDGIFQEYQGGNKTVICDLSNPGCIP